jgi:uncharacterized protein
MKLDRSITKLEVRFAQNDAKPGTFSGYGSVFNNLNSHQEVMKPGAFTKSLAEWKRQGSQPKMLLQHGGGFFGGGAEDGIPVGKWDRMEEDSKGLAVEGHLFALDTQKGKYIYEGLQSGALDGLSIGFVPVVYERNEEAKDDEPWRSHTEVDLWECSIVTFPSDGKALISDVRSTAAAIESLSQLKDFESYLRDAGFARAQATTFVSCLKKCLRQSDSEEQKEAALNARLDVLLSGFTKR